MKKLFKLFTVMACVVMLLSSNLITASAKEQAYPKSAANPRGTENPYVFNYTVTPKESDPNTVTITLKVTSQCDYDTTKLDFQQLIPDEFTVASTDQLTQTSGTLKKGETKEFTVEATIKEQYRPAATEDTTKPTSGETETKKPDGSQTGTDAATTGTDATTAATDAATVGTDAATAATASTEANVTNTQPTAADTTETNNQGVQTGDSMNLFILIPVCLLLALLISFLFLKHRKIARTLLLIVLSFSVLVPLIALIPAKKVQAEAGFNMEDNVPDTYYLKYDWTQELKKDVTLYGKKYTFTCNLNYKIDFFYYELSAVKEDTNIHIKNVKLEIYFNEQPEASYTTTLDKDFCIFVFPKNSHFIMRVTAPGYYPMYKDSEGYTVGQMKELIHEHAPVPINCIPGFLDMTPLSVKDYTPDIPDNDPFPPYTPVEVPVE